jgi:ACR3 family arsenite transporter
VGLARCIAMVLIWNMLAGGNSEDCAVLVALNSVFQIIMYSPLAYFYLKFLPDLFGADTAEVGVTMGDIAESVLIFLGIPLAAGIITRFALIRQRGPEWYDGEFAPRLGRTAIIGLLFTVVVMFSMQGEKIVDNPVDVLRIAIPLLAYFGLMFTLSFYLSHRMGFRYDESATLSFTAASNNFELAIAVAVGAFGIASGEALATVVGPLIEVPVLIGLVYVALWLGRRFYKGDASVPRADTVVSVSGD